MQIKITQIKEHKDGSATYSMEADQEFKEYTVKKYNKTYYTDKLGSRCVLDALHEMMVKEMEEALVEGYKLNGIKV